MNWTVIDTIACPNTGIVFSSIVSRTMRKLIIWYEGDVIISPGSIIKPLRSAIIVDGINIPLKIYNVTSFNQLVWSELKDKIRCQEAVDDHSPLCLSPFRCALKICPYGKVRPPEIA